MQRKQNIQLYLTTTKKRAISGGVAFYRQLYSGLLTFKLRRN